MNSRIIQLISEAEHFIESRQYAIALEQLAAAEVIEPDNNSIHMIRELVKSLQAEKPKPSVPKHFLLVTVDPKSSTGIKQKEAAPHTDVQRRVRSLTNSAEYFVSRGAVDNAFESLMRAYLLDPIAPEVLACEKRVLPAWQKLRGTPVSEAEHEWTLNVATPQQPTMQSSLFERLKAGKLLR